MVTDERLDRLILEDCAEGCTFFCDMDDAVATGELTRGKALAYRKAAKSLSAKLGVEVASF